MVGWPPRDWVAVASRWGYAHLQSPVAKRAEGRVPYEFHVAPVAAHALGCRCRHCVARDGDSTHVCCIVFAQHLETPAEMLAFFRKLGVPLQGMCDGRAQDGHWPHLTAADCVESYSAVGPGLGLGADPAGATQQILDAASATQWPNAHQDAKWCACGLRQQH